MTTLGEILYQKADDIVIDMQRHNRKMTSDEHDDINFWTNLLCIAQTASKVLIVTALLGASTDIPLQTSGQTQAPTCVEFCGGAE